MYCPNCGAGNFGPDANFCYECGTQLSNFQGLTPSVQSNMTHNVQVQQKITNQPLNTPLFKYSNNAIGANSKRSLGFSLVSLGLLVVNIIVSFGILMFWLRRGTGSGLETVNNAKFLSFIPATILGCLGVIFGIIGIIFSSRARSEIYDKVEKAGSILSILGIAFNCFAIGLVILNGPILTFWPQPVIPPPPI